MQVDNGQFSEQERAEAYRVESMQQLIRQTTALETTAKKVTTIEIVVSLWFTLMLIAGALLLLASLNS